MPTYESGFKSFSEVFKEKDFNGLRHTVEEYAVVDRFYDLFSDLKEIVEPKKISAGVLYLKVENSVWRSELNFKQELMKNRINKYFKKDLVKQIKFVC